MATKINLLPWRAELREQRKKDFLTILAGCALVGALVFAIWYLAIQSLIDYQKMRNQKLQSEISLLDKKVDEINALKKQRMEMIDRMKVIQSLQGTRPLIVHIFDEIVRTQPDGVFFSKIERKDNRIFVTGTAESNNRVSTLMRDLGKSEWFENPLLTKVQANPTLGEQGTDFNLTVDVSLPQVSDEGGK
ncbi:MAG: PilN domain-containing protein [Cellvibrionales bacterium]|mgnify:FL=1|jgi:type IV pilus assembly protein PilN|nr:PilN domain-containing protein [Cellvibrionales bacterium]